MTAYKLTNQERQAAVDEARRVLSTCRKQKVGIHAFDGIEKLLRNLLLAAEAWRGEVKMWKDLIDQDAPGCLGTCDRTGHDDGCPDASFHEEYKLAKEQRARLRAEVARLREAIEEIRQHLCPQRCVCCTTIKADLDVALAGKGEVKP